MESNERLTRHASHASIWQLVLAVIGGLVAGVPAAVYLISGQVERKVSEKAEPFEHLFFGSFLSNSGLPDDAVPEFRAGFDSMMKNSAGSDGQVRLAVYLDKYLDCLVNTENPARFRSDFERCRRVFSRQLVTETFNHKLLEGYYLMRLQELDESGALMKAALHLANAEFATNTSAGPKLARVEVGMCYYQLCMGEAKQALGWEKSSNAHAYRDSSINFNEGDPINRSLTLLYPKFGPTFRAFVELVDAEQVKNEPTDEETKSK